MDEFERRWAENDASVEILASMIKKGSPKADVSVFADKILKEGLEIQAAAIKALEECGE